MQFFRSGSGKTALLHPIGTSLSKAANTVKFVSLYSLHFAFIFSRLQDSMTSVFLKNSQRCQVNMGTHKFGSIQQGIVFVCVKVSESSIFYIFQNETKSHVHFCCTFQIIEKNGQISRSRLFRWEFPLRNWILCFWPFQVRNPPRNVDKTATLLSTYDFQHHPLCVPHPHLLFLIWFAFRVECFYVEVKRKILETLDNKVYTWKWHQVLGRSAS